MSTTVVRFKDILEPAVNLDAWITSMDVSDHLAQDLKQKSVGGAHWFREADFWFRLNHGYNNPLNVGCVHSELFSIYERREVLSRFLPESTLVFLGVGVGDTEMAVVDLQLDASGYSESVAIDVNSVFLRSFVRLLRNRKIEDSYIIRYAAVETLFETLIEALPAGPLRISDARFPRRTYVCLGSTIGNYKSLTEPFGLFSGLARRGDRLLLGYQLDRELKRVFQKYEANPLYRDLVGNFLRPDERSRITWTLNEAGCSVEAWWRDIQIFRSRKFGSKEVGGVAGQYGWQEAFCFVDKWQNMCLHGFEKT
jgi:Histidine-specific methyltransferase, SAM-dependent